MAAVVPWMTAEEILASPFVLYAETAARPRRNSARRHELYGFDSVTTHQPSMEALGQVIAAYRGAPSSRLPLRRADIPVPIRRGCMTRLVLKLGSSSIASGDGLALDVIADLVTQIAAAQRERHR